MISTIEMGSRAMQAAFKRPAPPPVEVSDDDFLNRDLSWLDFNERVLREAVDERTPLLERVRFLGIFSSNQDEFFMKRVGAIRRAAGTGMVSRTPDDPHAAQLLSAMRCKVGKMLAEQAGVFARSIRPALAAEGIRLLEWDELTEEERGHANRFFRSSVFPVLTPLAVDPGHPFPLISNLSVSLGLVLSPPDRDEPSFARVKIPEVLPGWVQLPTAGPEYRFFRLRELVEQNIGELFPGMVIREMMPFRVTRDIEVDVEDEEGGDLRDVVEQELRQRRFAHVVRLEHCARPSGWILQFLMRELKLTEQDVYEAPGDLDYGDLFPVADLNLPKLRYAPWTPTVPPALGDDSSSIFSQLRHRDVLVHHPYESFSASVERFVKAAAEDPKVLAIKMTVYRTGEDSTFIHQLIRAAESGKQVVCLVELKARFDEERNIVLAHALEKAGVHVVYGVVGLKTHTKTTLVVRQDPDGIRCYAHIGTGNYHVQTARLYTDVGLLTSRAEITEDLVELFHYLTGRSVQRASRKLLVAPRDMRERFLAMIEREVEHATAGRGGRIIAKMNALEDRKIGRALYAASQAGVEVDLVVRGFCCLRPGLAGLSENIRVISVVGRFLEHSRIFYFRNGASEPLDGEFYIGSADWMYRNLLHRVEAAVPVEDHAGREKLWEILQTLLHDDRQAWEMNSDGSYVQRRPVEGEPERGTHQVLMRLARERSSSMGLLGK